MARTLIIGADNTISIQYLSVPDTSPVQYINGATITWSLQDLSGNVLGTGSFSALSDSSSEIQGAYDTTVPASLTNTLKANNAYNFLQTAVSSGFTSTWTDQYTAISSPSPDITYANRIDMENIFGKVNIKQWADIDNDGNLQTIDARVLWSLILSYNMVNSKLLGGIYSVPLKGSYPIIIYTQAALAAVKLYESRGITNTSEDGTPIHQLLHHKKEAMNNLAQIRAGVIRIDGALSADILGTAYPAPIKTRSCYRGLSGFWSGW